MRHGEEMLLTFAEGTDDPARPVPGGARPVVAAGAAAVRARLEARRRADALAHQVRAQRGAARPLGAEVRPAAHRLRLHDPRSRPAPRPRHRAVGDRADRLVAPQGHARQRRTRLRPPDRGRRPALVRHRVGARRARRRRGGGARDTSSTRPSSPTAVARPRWPTVDDPSCPASRSSSSACSSSSRRRRRRRSSIGLIPTFSGCPALALIAATRPRRGRRRSTGCAASTSRSSRAPAWSVDRISERGARAARRPARRWRSSATASPRARGAAPRRSSGRCSVRRAAGRSTVCPACGEAVEVMRDG